MGFPQENKVVLEGHPRRAANTVRNREAWEDMALGGKSENLCSTTGHPREVGNG